MKITKAYKPNETNHYKAENVVSMVLEGKCLCYNFMGKLCLI